MRRDGRMYQCRKEHLSKNSLMSVPSYMIVRQASRKGATKRTDESNVVFHVALGCEALRVREATEG